MKNWLSIGEFSKETGLSIKTLRHYQDVSLLIPYARGENNYRYYTNEQVSTALQIRDYKSMGFSLEDIKTILGFETQEPLKKIIEERLEEIHHEELNLSHQKKMLTSILTSFDLGLDLSNQQKEFIMEDVFKSGIEGLKRRGVPPNPGILKEMETEVAGWLPVQKNVLQAIRHIMDVAKKRNILIGSGRGSSASSLILFSEGYTQYNPLKFDLIPEIYSGGEYFWMDVEFSKSHEIGDLVKRYAQDLNYKMRAFKCPFLDIMSQMQEKVGSVDFNSFANESYGMSILNEYRDLKQSKIKYPFLKKSSQDLLNSSNGMLIWREDWIKIFNDYSGISYSVANQIYRSLAQERESAQELKMLHSISDKRVVDLLVSEVKNMFMKSHVVANLSNVKKSAILKALWKNEYLQTIAEWEQKNGLVWQDFGYVDSNGIAILEA